MVRMWRGGRGLGEGVLGRQGPPAPPPVLSLLSECIPSPPLLCPQCPVSPHP